MNRETVSATIQGRDQVEVSFLRDGQYLKDIQLSAVGCFSFLKRMNWLKFALLKPVDQIEIPEDGDHASLIVKEVILKIRRQWKLPYQDEELCHCRKVTTSEVDQAIVCGASTPEKVGQWTSAGTACGTCRGDIEQMIKYRRVG